MQPCQAQAHTAVLEEHCQHTIWRIGGNAYNGQEPLEHFLQPVDAMRVLLRGRALLAGRHKQARQAHAQSRNQCARCLAALPSAIHMLSVNFRKLKMYMARPLQGSMRSSRRSHCAFTRKTPSSEFRGGLKSTKNSKTSGSTDKALQDARTKLGSKV